MQLPRREELISQQGGLLPGGGQAYVELVLVDDSDDGTPRSSVCTPRGAVEVMPPLAEGKEADAPSSAGAGSGAPERATMQHGTAQQQAEQDQLLHRTWGALHSAMDDEDEGSSVAGSVASFAVDAQHTHDR